MKLGFLRNPFILVLVPLCASFAAWSVPGASESLRGFRQRVDVTVTGSLVLLAWYGLCLLAILLGFSFGRSVPAMGSLSRYENDGALESRLFRMLLVLAGIGIVYSTIRVSSQVDVVAVLVDGTGNSLKQALGGEAGPATLRYTSSLAAPIGLHLYRSGRISAVEMYIAIGTLAMNVVFASRLSLLLAIVIYGVLVAVNYPHARVRLRILALLAIALFLALTALNASRNSNYYADQGVANPAEANLFQILTYLGAPVQASLGVADAVGSGRFPDVVGPNYGADVAVPSFFKQAQGPDQASADGSSNDISTAARSAGDERYKGQAEVSSLLTTNSAFADTLNDYGYWGLWTIIPTLIVAGGLFGHFSKYKSIVAALAGVIAYTFAELWRVYLLAQGIIIYLVIVMFVAAAGVSLVSSGSVDRESVTVQ